MRLDDVHQGVVKHRKRKRIGRGVGSGTGKTAGAGHKGHKSRSGYSRKPVFQGGAMPLVRRVPKRGFNNRFALVVAAVNLGAIEQAFPDGAEVTPASLRAADLIGSQFDVVKILGDGTLTKRLKVVAHRFSKSAREQIERAGGQVVQLPGKKLIGKAAQRAAQAAANPPAAPATDVDPPAGE
ncbi:MAG: 50S ribosomal protein L15 [Pirellulaceae bacterium]|nr:50S ribosomal protein L15 [Pirellulaceae bacterium]